MDHEPTKFVCTDCGYEIHRLTAPPGYVSSTCFVCQWLNQNEKLTDKERQTLRVMLRPPTDDLSS